MANRQTIDDRRRQVWEMHVRGVPETVIANAFQVHRNTIINDVRILRQKHRKEIVETDVHAEIGDTVRKYNDIFEAAMAEVSTSELPSQKAAFMSQAQTALTNKVRFLVEVGVLPKAAHEVAGKIIVEGVDVERASVEELTEVRNRLLQRLVTASKLRLVDHGA